MCSDSSKGEELLGVRHGRLVWRTGGMFKVPNLKKEGKKWKRVCG